MDLPNSVAEAAANPSFHFSLAAGDTLAVSGTAGTSPIADQKDVFRLDASTAFTVDITGFSGGGLNGISGLVLYDAAQTMIDVAVFGSPTTDVFGRVGPGSYFLDFDETGSSTSYTLEISAVPLPGALGFLIASLGALGLLRRRQAQVSTV